MPNANRPLAAITGASSGIGRELAECLAMRGHDLLLVARREEALQQLATALNSVHGVDCTPLVADLATYEGRETVVRHLEPLQSRLEVLVNNAGFGTHGFFRETSLERELELIQVNCAAPVHLTKRILPWMLERQRGYILNVGSVSGFMPGPVMAMYYASKAFVQSFSDALWEECRGTGVRVTTLAPGPVRTEFQRIAGIASTARTSGATPVPVRQVAEEALAGLFSGRRVVIPGRSNRLAVLAAKLLPRETILRRVRAIQEERRRQTLAAGSRTNA
jgi:short-subunit dehydrogenase